MGIKITKEKEIKKINELQDMYVNKLIEMLNSSILREEINFTSPTGTGKSKMIAKLINSNWGKDKFFIITTLSRGELNIQLKNSLEKDCPLNNFIVYGSSQLTVNTILTAEDVRETVLKQAKGKLVFWIRDEAHIETNTFRTALKGIYEKIINISATNEIEDIVCDFSSTGMLRTPIIDKTGDVSSALDKLLKIKKLHSIIPNYNPCAVFRCINNPTLHSTIEKECEKRKLKYVDLNENDVSVLELCEDDNKYDVIINKMKIVEGVDLKRAHIMYLGNVPSNPKTVIQFAGRARRNALLWRNDFDIFNEKYKELFNSTRECFVYFNTDCKNDKQAKEVDDMLTNAFRNIMSVEDFAVGAKLEVINGVLPNGMTVYQLQGQDGVFEVVYDEKLGCKVVNPLGDFYQEEFVNINYVPENGYRVYSQQMWGRKDEGYYDVDKDSFLPKAEYYPYTLKPNDYELAALSSQYFKYYSSNKVWTAVKDVSSLLDKTSGITLSFIEKKYKKELEEGFAFIEENALSSGKNNFDFDKTCNSCLGWMVEFYTKYLVFGKEFLFNEIKDAQKEANTDDENNHIIFYACFLKYKKMMMSCFGDNIARFIKGPSISDYIKGSYDSFVSTVVELAQKTQKFLIEEKGFTFKKNGLLFSENLSNMRFSAKADFVCEDTIIDLKTTNNITKRYIRQVLFYHWLSTKRSDLNIKKVIVYDCVSGSSVEIPIREENLTNFYNPLNSSVEELPWINIEQAKKIQQEKADEEMLKKHFTYEDYLKMELRAKLLMAQRRQKKKELKKMGIEVDLSPVGIYIFKLFQPIKSPSKKRMEIQNKMVEISQTEFININDFHNKVGKFSEIYYNEYKCSNTFREVVEKSIIEDKGLLMLLTLDEYGVFKLYQNGKQIKLMTNPKQEQKSTVNPKQEQKSTVKSKQKQTTKNNTKQKQTIKNKVIKLINKLRRKSK